MFVEENNNLCRNRSKSLAVLYCVIVCLAGCAIRGQEIGQDHGDLLQKRVDSTVASLERSGFFAGSASTIWLLEIESDHERAMLWIATRNDDGMYVRTFDCTYAPLELSLRSDCIYSDVSTARFNAMAVLFTSDQPFVPGRDVWASTGGAFSGKNSTYKRTASLQFDIEEVSRRLSRGVTCGDTAQELIVPIELGMPSLIAHYYSAE